MARLPLLNEADLALGDRDVLSRPINLYRVFAHCPGMARQYRELARWIKQQGELPAQLRELAVLQVGYVTHAEYEWSHHIKLGLEAGLSREEIEAISLETAGQPTALDPTARHVLAAARELAVAGELSDEIWEALVAALGGTQALELCGVIAFYAMTVRLLAALRVDVEPEYALYLEQFPLTPA
jgi:alkylhydroperoxidase family enzyme